MNRRTILLAGDWQYSFYEDALATGMRGQKYNVIPHVWDSINVAKPLYFWKLRSGRVCAPVERRLIERVREVNPTAVFLNRPDRIRPAAIKTIRRLGVHTFLYHNDNVFAGFKRQLTLRHFRSLIPIVDHNFVYRPADADRYVQCGAKSVSLLPPYYDPSIHRPSKGVTKEFDLAFIGHFEADGRDQILLEMIRRGFSVLVSGPPSTWRLASRGLQLAVSEPIRAYTGHSYADALSRGRLGLVFLSKFNQDVYTRRCFEYPAIGLPTLMPGTRELKAIFGGGCQCFYEDVDDLERLSRFYLKNKDAYDELLFRQAAIAKKFSADAAAKRAIAAVEGILMTNI